MVKKTLEEKIKDVVFYAAVFFIIYLIIGFLIQTEYLHCVITWDKLYELFRDALTLTAYFLAPVTAFVLFSDWREPHVEKTIEDDSSKIYEGINNAINELLRILFEIDDHDNFKENNDSIPAKLIDELSEKIEKLNMLNVHLGARGSVTKNFTECAASLLKQIKGLNNELAFLCTYQLKIQNPHVYNDLACDNQDFAEEIQESYDGLYSQILRTVPELKSLERKLKTLCDELKIKV